MQRRKATFKLYPNAAQARQLEDWLRMHAELYNAALEARIDAYREAGVSLTYYDQQNQLPEIKADRPAFVALGSHALQETLRRLDRAFAGFFRRVKAGQRPGFPRFKSSRRFPGFCYPDPVGWKLMQNGARGATLRIGSGKNAMMIRARGRHRFESFRPNDLTLSQRRNAETGQIEWTASVTLRVADTACARERTSDDRVGVDLGLEHWANFDDGTQIDNPRWVRKAAGELADLQRQRARKRRGSVRYKRLSRRIQRLHRTTANRRHDFVHKQTTGLAKRCAVIATEELQPSNMSRSARGSVAAPGRRVRQKAGLNREILSAGMAMTHQMLAYKVTETGTRLHVAKTRRLKPSQRCSQCWAASSKPLSQREHRCGCGCVMPRDQNSARVVLIDASTPTPPPGTGGAAKGKPLTAKAIKAKAVKSTLMTRETPTTVPRA